ncbi:MAG: DUF4126 domain-containing protein [Coriobacteriaceae bacterium]|nr:DUF4126 domain-containing protein [Coriobacteriaceae bacterium]
MPRRPNRGCTDCTWRRWRGVAAGAPDRGRPCADGTSRPVQRALTRLHRRGELTRDVDLLTAIGLAVPAGLNAYIPLFAVAVAQRLGWLELAEPYSLVGEWWAIALIVVLGIVEFAADKIPAVDHVNDVVQTLVRPAAGGILMAGASGQVGQDYPAVMIVCGVLLAGAVHVAKASARSAVNAATGGTGAPVVSLLEDALAAVSSVVAIIAPVLVALMVAGTGWMLWRWRRRGQAASG